MFWATTKRVSLREFSSAISLIFCCHSANSTSLLLGYGYEKVEDLYAVVDQYRGVGIPLDGLHIDVDFQVYKLPETRPETIWVTNSDSNRTGSELSPPIRNISLTRKGCSRNFGKMG